MIDVDDFKTINDTYGHMFGDEVLSRVSELIRSVMDSRGVAGRFGGDEFMVLFENIESEKDLRSIRKMVQAWKNSLGKQIRHFISQKQRVKTVISYMMNKNMEIQ